MGLFDKFLNKKNDVKVVEKTNDLNISKNTSIFDTDYPINKSNGYEVFSACLGRAITVQEACGEIVVKGQNWNVDFAKGTLAFGNDVYPMELIGSESNSSNTWLWGWENVNGFDEKIIKFAKETKEIAKDWGFQALVMEQFDLDEVYNGHNMSIIACGIAKENYCYYRGPHGGGAVFMAFSGVPEEVFAPVDALKFSDTTLKCIQGYDINHKIFVESYLVWNRTKYEWVGDKIVAYFENELHIEFEQVEAGLRIKSIESVLGKK